MTGGYTIPRLTGMSTASRDTCLDVSAHHRGRDGKIRTGGLLLPNQIWAVAWCCPRQLEAASSCSYCGSSWWPDVAALICGPAWSNEGLFTFCQAIHRLSRVGSGRVNLPTIELEP